MGEQGPPAALEGITHVDYRGREHVLGRTRDGYAIWRRATGGSPAATFPLSVEGWTDAWAKFRDLEGLAASEPWAGDDPLDLQPATAGVILGRTFRMWGRWFWTLVGIAAVLLVPADALLLGLNLATLRTVERSIDGISVSVPQIPGWLTLTQNVSTFVLAAIITGAVLVAVVRALLGARPTIRGSLRVALRRGASLVWAVLLQSFAVGAPMIPGLAMVVGSQGGGTREGFGLAGTVLFFVGAVIAAALFVRLIFTPVVVVLEGGRGVDALGRAWRLSRGFGWRILGVLVLATLIVGGMFLLGLLLLTPILIQGELAAETFRTFFIAVFVLSAIIGALANPLFGIATVQLYLDARIRKEALSRVDLERELSVHG